MTDERARDGRIGTLEARRNGANVRKHRAPSLHDALSFRLAYLRAKGWSARRISREFGISARMVARILEA